MAWQAGRTVHAKVCCGQHECCPKPTGGGDMLAWRCLPRPVGARGSSPGSAHARLVAAVGAVGVLAASQWRGGAQEVSFSIRVKARRAQGSRCRSATAWLSCNPGSAPPLATLKRAGALPLPASPPHQGLHTPLASAKVPASHLVHLLGLAPLHDRQPSPALHCGTDRGEQAGRQVRREKEFNCIEASEARVLPERCG